MNYKDDAFECRWNEYRASLVATLDSLSFIIRRLER